MSERENVTEFPSAVTMRSHRGSMFFRVDAGSGEVDGVKFELASNVGDGSLLVRFEDDDVTWAVGFRDVVEAAIAQRKSK